MMEKSFILKGNVAFSKNLTHMETIDNGYLVCVDGLSKGVYTKLPEQFEGLPIYDYGDHLIVPGMMDLHLHAPQYTFRGIGMDLELLDWLSTHTFPEEARYNDIDYAKKAYQYFCYDLKRSFTTRACIFATLHTEATIELMDQIEATGVITYVGKVNMDRNGVENLEETDANASINATLDWINRIEGRYVNTKPIITPRFIPSCSNDLMRKLGMLSKEKNLRIQSHLSENKSEVAWVGELVPESTCYANAYEIFGALGSPELPSIMAHCVYSDEKERAILKKYGTYVAHCPNSNMNLTSGIAPIRKFLEEGIPVGIGTDVAAGSSMNMFHTILDTIMASKMYYRLVDTSAKPLTFEEAFCLATKLGGSYFGKVGSFEDGYEFDALVLDDSAMYSMRTLSVRERVERVCYNDVDCVIREKFVAGKHLFSK